MSATPPDVGDQDRLYRAIEDMDAAPGAGEVTLSWRRSLLEYRVNPDAPQAPQILTGTELRDKRAPVEELIALAAEENDRLHVTVGKVGYVVLLTSPGGVVVDVRGDPNRADQFVYWGVWKGGVWSEEIEGTNGIGTSIAEQRPVTVHRSQHFRARHASLSCCGAPIFDPSGKLAAVLDVSSIDPVVSERSHALAFAVTVDAARAVEERYFRQTFLRAWILAVAIPSRFTTLMLAVDDDQRIVGADHAARATLSLGSESLAGALSLWQFFVRSPQAFRARSDDLATSLTRIGDEQSWRVLVTPPIREAAGAQASFHTRPRIGREGAMPAASGVVPADPKRASDVSLSPQEAYVLGLIGQGQSNKEIARQLEISPETVKSHVKHIFAKLDVERRAQAIYRAKDLGLLG